MSTKTEITISVRQVEYDSPYRQQTVVVREVEHDQYVYYVLIGSQRERLYENLIVAGDMIELGGNIKFVDKVVEYK